MILPGEVLNVGYTLHLGDCLDVMRGMESESVSAVITDPPYGLSKEPDAAEVLRHWLAGDRYTHSGSGFMGKSWDSFVPGPEYWREVYRVMRPGAHLLCFAGTRTWDLMSMAIRLAGFENRDTIASFGVPALAWTFGSGFPKSTSVSKQIDKAAGAERKVVGPNANTRPNSAGRQSVAMAAKWSVTDITTPATDAAKKWDGWHTAMKPAWECILVFRRPLSEPTVAANVLRHGTGAINVGATRVGHNESEKHTTRTAQRAGTSLNFNTGRSKSWQEGTSASASPAGRFPPNLVLSHVPPDENGHGGCEPWGTKRVRGANKPSGTPSNSRNVYGTYGEHAAFTYADPDGLQEVAAWDCSEGCPILELDRQSGIGKSHVAPGQVIKRRAETGYSGGWKPSNADAGQYADTGGASRFFPCFTPDPPDVPFRYVAKASRRERNEGCEGLPERRSGTGALRAEQGGEYFIRIHEPDPDVIAAYLKEWRERRGLSKADIDRRLGTVTLYSWYEGRPAGTELPTPEMWLHLKSILDFDDRHDEKMTMARSVPHAERSEPVAVKSNHHPTVKPLALMTWLARLVCPPDGTILDPFMGSGSTGVAALRSGFSFVGIEQDVEYHAIAERRLQTALSGQQPLLLGAD